MRKLPVPDFNMGQCKIIRRIIGKFADSGVGFDVGLQFERMTGNSVNGSGHHHHL
jgi:hypothetical protein